MLPEKKVRRKANLTERAFHFLEKSIMDVLLAPGERISEAKVARSLKMSRGPVREALRKLESVGLVTREANRGARVTEFNERELSELDALRSHLLTMAGRLATELATPEQIGKMRLIVEEMGEAVAAEDYIAYPEMNTEFHRLLNEMSANAKLSALIEQVYRQISRYHVLAMSYREGLVDSLGSHRRILAAIENREPAAAERELAEHGRLSYRVLLENFGRLRRAFRANGTPRQESGRPSGSGVNIGHLPSASSG